MAVWHSSQTDRAKRRMLEAALRVTEVDRTTDLGEEIKWILKRADELEEDRNNAIHAPLFHMGSNAGLASSLLVELPSGVFADVLSGNPRAEKLVARNILAEFGKYALDIETGHGG